MRQVIKQNKLQTIGLVLITIISGYFLLNMRKADFIECTKAYGGTSYVFEYNLMGWSFLSLTALAGILRKKKWILFVVAVAMVVMLTFWRSSLEEMGNSFMGGVFDLKNYELYVTYMEVYSRCIMPTFAAVFSFAADILLQYLLTKK